MSLDEKHRQSDFYSCLRSSEGYRPSDDVRQDNSQSHMLGAFMKPSLCYNLHITLFVTKNIMVEQ